MTAPIAPPVVDTTEKRLHRGAVICLVLLLIGLIVGFVSFSKDDTTKASAADSGLIKQQDKALSGLIVDYDKVSADQCNTLVQKYFGAKDVLSLTVNKTKVQTVAFDIGAMHSVVGSTKEAGQVQRLWSDATNIPLTSRTLEEEQAFVCHDPEQAAMVMNRIGTGSIGDSTVASQNSWMQAQGDPKTAISSWAQHCWTKDVATHLACAKTMAATATLLGKFASEGVHKASSSWNIHCANGCLAASNVVPAFALNPKQEQNAYFLVISVTAKTGGCFLKYGFNVGLTAPNGGDQRLAGLTCVPPKPKSPPTSPPTGHHTPSCHDTHTCPTPPPGCKSTHTCPTPPPCTHKCNPPKTCKDLYGPGYVDDNGHSYGYAPCHKAAVVDGHPVVPPPPTNAPGPNPSPVPVTPSGQPTAIPSSSQCYDPNTGLPVPKGTAGAWCS